MTMMLTGCFGDWLLTDEETGHTASDEAKFYVWLAGLLGPMIFLFVALIFFGGVDVHDHYNSRGNYIGYTTTPNPDNQPDASTFGLAFKLGVYWMVIYLGFYLFYGFWV